MRSLFRKLRNHIVTGFLFVMPILICLAVLGKFWNDLLKYGERLSKLLHLHTLLGPAGDAVLAIILFLLICTGAGFFIRITYLKRLRDSIDEKLGQIIPGYNQLKSQTQKQIGVEKKADHIYPACLVSVQEVWQPGYVIEDNEDGTNTVFVPQAPSHAGGQVYIVPEVRLRRLQIDSKTLNSRLQQFGKGIGGRQ